jgi:D-lactate dehydrogenase (cytochrome)
MQGMSNQAAPELAGITYSIDPKVVAGYLSDESSAYVGSADIVYLPKDQVEIGRILNFSTASGQSVSIAGAGTSLTGARVPAAGVVLSVEKLRHVDMLEPAPEAGEWDLVRGPDYSFRVSATERLAVVPAGVRLFELNDSLETYRLAYPPDPTERSAMLGGTIATNASGARSFAYGATRRWIEALLVVGTGGSAQWIRRGEFRARRGVLPLPDSLGGGSVVVGRQYAMPQTKNAAGLYLSKDVDLIDVIVGSEGILCVVVAALVGLSQRPENVVQVAAFFHSEEEALLSADEFRPAEGVLSIEYFDPGSLEFMRIDYPDIPPAPSACVLVEFDAPAAAGENPYPPPSVIERWGRVIDNCGAKADWTVAGEEIAAMKAFRHSLPEQVNRWVSQRVGKLGTDMAVPGERFSEMFDAYREARAGEISAVLFGHLGQYHLHLNFLPEDQDQLKVAKSLYRELARTSVRLGGTISAEHGVGKKTLVDSDGTPKPYLWYMYGEMGIRAIADVKRACDPHGILNPGTMIPAE